MLFLVPSHLYAECVNLVQMKCILSPSVCSRQSVNLVDKPYRKWAIWFYRSFLNKMHSR